MAVEAHPEELEGFPLWIPLLALTPLVLRKRPPATGLVVEPVPPVAPVLTPVPGQPGVFLEPERVAVPVSPAFVYPPAPQALPTAGPVLQPLAPQRPVVRPKTEAGIRLQKKVSEEAARVVLRHEASIKKRLGVEAQKLVKAGVAPQQIEREVQAVLKTLPSSQTKKAADELKKTGAVSAATRAAVNAAHENYQSLHPELKNQLRTVKREAQKAVNKILPGGFPGGFPTSKADVVSAVQREAQKAVNKILPGGFPGGFPTSKADVVSAVQREVQKLAPKVVKDAQREISAFTKNLPPAAKDAGEALYKSLREGKIDEKALLRLGEKTGKDLLKKYGDTYGKQALHEAAKMSGINIPGDVPIGAIAEGVIKFAQDPSLKGAVDAGYTSLKSYGEAFLQSKTGIPIQLPRKVSAKEIERTFNSLIPKNAADAMELALSIATQAAASVLTTVLAGTAIGSVIPGLGTVVGVAAALVVSAVREMVTPGPPAHLRECKGISKCPKTPSGVITSASAMKHWAAKNCKNPYPLPEFRKADGAVLIAGKPVSPMELLPWIAETTFPITKALAEEQAKHYCGVGEIVTYLAVMDRMADQIVDLALGRAASQNSLGSKPRVSGTVETLGIPQLERLIALYEKAPKNYYRFDIGRQVSGGAVVGGTKKVILVPHQNLQRILTAMKSRRAQLQKLLRDTVTNLGKIPSTANSPSLVDNVMRPISGMGGELERAAVQYYLSNQSEDTKQWLGILLGIVQIAETKRAAILKNSMNAQAQRNPSGKFVTTVT